MDAESRVREHYSRDDLEGVVLRALRDRGVDTEALTEDDLGGLDQLHSGGVASTEHVLDALDLSPDDHVLDVGCGVGGPARRAAGRGCRVTGIDLSPDFVALARALTERVGLADRVTIDEGSAVDLPYDDGTFTRAMQNHVGMNIDDKASVFTEVHRVLAPGGVFGVYDVVRVGDGGLTFPLPWAEDESSSFVVSRDGYVSLLEDAGFAVESVEDQTPALAEAGPPPAGALSPADLFGPTFDERLGNAIGSIMTGTLSPTLVLARRP